jgi:hypothetical protein
MRITLSSLTGALLILLLAASCAAPGLPYLYVFSNTSYTAGTSVVVSYSFLSESEEQPCRVELYNIDFEPYDPSYHVYSNGDKDIKNQGELVFDSLVTGTYKLEFTVLSKRFFQATELPYLSETVGFTVVP